MEFINSNFPQGLCVLAVDDNPVCLKFLEGLLKQCCYEVTTTPSAEFAIDLVRKNKENFDIIITDIETDQRNGFMLLKTIALEMGLPVLMVSPDNDRETLLKGIKHGASGYLVKPPSLKQIQNIGQLVLTHKKTKSILSKILKKREIRNRMKKYLSDLKANCPGTSQISHLGVTLDASIHSVVTPQPHLLPSAHSTGSGKRSFIDIEHLRAFVW
ncbi:two-component response regulator ARR10-like [Papaver somniferum]|uniref:two-component response regulator ARR10-like n=1 Tax=Papaver somniferum TaxID=3469 RepID=UPI000E6F6D55|nr:two-component response regulator ARR10-like [Papaver somniferum]